MAKKLNSENEVNLPQLSRRESQIMDILYSKGECSVADLVEYMPGEMTRSAVRTFLVLLEGKKCIQRRKQGREYIYQAATDKKMVAKSALGKVLNVFFNGSLSSAVAAQFTDNSNKIDEKELKELEALIKKVRNQQK